MRFITEPEPLGEIVDRSMVATIDTVRLAVFILIVAAAVWWLDKDRK